MGNCSNITNTQTVALTAGTLTTGFCHETLQTTFEEFVSKTTGNLSGNMAAFTAGDDEPATADNSKLWYKQDGSACSDPGGFYFRNSASTEVATGSMWEPIEGSTPIGSIVMFGGVAAPTHWLLCNGGTFVVADYPLLNAVLGTSYGVAGTLPDLKGRVPVGYGTGSGLTARALNAKGGTETHLLTGAESGTSVHKHPTIPGGTAASASSAPAGTAGGTASSGYTSDSVAASAASAHENMQPFITVNFIIRAI